MNGRQLLDAWQAADAQRRDEARAMLRLSARDMCERDTIGESELRALDAMLRDAGLSRSNFVEMVATYQRAAELQKQISSESWQALSAEIDAVGRRFKQACRAVEVLAFQAGPHVDAAREELDAARHELGRVREKLTTFQARQKALERLEEQHKELFSKVQP